MPINTKAVISLMIYLGFHSATAFAASGEIDLKKFISKANQELETVYGKNNLESDAKLYFQDGAGIGLEPFSDFATLTLVRKPKFIPVSAQVDYVGYRLELNGTLRIMNISRGICRPPFCTPAPNNSLALGFIFPETILVAFGKSPITDKQLQHIAHKIMSAFPDSKVKLLEAISVMQINSHPLDMNGIISLVSQESQYSGFDLDFETYASPFEFDPATEVEQLSRTLDLDQLRTLTKKLKNQGIRFVTETTIPDSLKP